MMVMAATFIGGTSIFGGEASIEGTFIGAFINPKGRIPRACPWMNG